MNATLAQLRQHLDTIEDYHTLQDERGRNDIRRQLIQNELKEIERLVVELRRKNQS